MPGRALPAVPVRGPEARSNRIVFAGQIVRGKGVDVLLIDTDPQGSATNWAGTRALAENLEALISAINKAKPASTKGIYLKKVSVSSTMGVGVRVDQRLDRRRPTAVGPAQRLRRRAGGRCDFDVLLWDQRQLLGSIANRKPDRPIHRLMPFV